MAQEHHIQYPVGHGGLHLGIIGDIAYIYDCGTLHKKSSTAYTPIFNEIQNLLSHCKKLHIFISHLHSDHYNLLPELDKCISAKTTVELYLPQTTFFDKIALLLSEPDIGSYETLYNTIDKNRFFDLEHIQATKYIKANHGKSIILSDNTILKPYVVGIDKDEIADFVSRCGYNTPEKLWQALKDKEVFKNFREKFETLYKNKINHEQGENNVMLCLYCGAENTCCACCNANIIENCIIEHLLGGCGIRNAWLHTGDVNLQGSQNIFKLIKHFKALLCNVMFLQIPHHGSKHNHDRKIISLLPGHNKCFAILYYTCNAHRNMSDILINQNRIKDISDQPITKIQL